MIVLYRILTYLLIPFALLFGILGFFAFFMALANPGLLLGVFMLVGFCIYTFCSLKFLHTGLLGRQNLTLKLRDWMKVNAYVALPFAIINLLQGITILSRPAMLGEVIQQMLDMQQQMGVKPLPAAIYTQMLMVLVYIMLVFSLVLIVHLQQSFYYLRKYRDLFMAEDSPLR